MKRHRIVSSAIAGLGYEAGTNVLEVEFHTGRIYDYYQVPADVYDDLRNSESIGAYFNREIRDKYNHEEVFE